jgi:AcrR family transcriptional regulator
MGIIERKEREKEQRRNNILDAAEEVFFGKGFELSTMDDIALKSELSKGTLYLYFRSKEELYFAISIRALQALRRMFESAIDTGKPVIERILETGRTFVKFAREKPDYFKTLVHFEAVFDLQHVHEQYTKLCDNEEDPMSYFTGLLQQAIAEGVLRADIPAVQLAHILWIQTTGVLKLASTKNFHYDLSNVSEDEIIMNHFEIINHGFRRKN